MKQLLTALLIAFFVFGCNPQYGESHLNDTKQKEREHDEVLDVVSDWVYDKCNEYFDKSIFLANASGNRDSIDKYNYFGRAMREVFMKVISLKYRNKKSPPKPSPLPDTTKPLFDSLGIKLAKSFGFPQYPHQTLLIWDKKGDSFLYMDSSGWIVNGDPRPTVLPKRFSPSMIDSVLKQEWNWSWEEEPDTTKPIKDSGLIDWSNMEIRCGVSHCTEDGCFSCDYHGHYYPFIIYNDSIRKWFVKMDGNDSIFYYRHKDDTMNYIWDGRYYTIDYGDGISSSLVMPRSGSDTFQLVRQVWESFLPIQKPSPLPDTSKPIKDKIKMQPRWREDSIHVQPTVYYPNDSLIWVRPTDSSGWIILSQYEKWTSKVDTTLIYEGTDIPEWELQVSDTQKVIMLVADTSSQNGFRSSRCFWMFGYVIQEQKVLLPSMPPYMTYNETVGYLDDRHLPLPKNIVVWMSKELK